MKCPFCTEPVEDEAVVCKTCRRDITIPKPVMEANRALETKVAALEAEVAELRARLAWYRDSVRASTGHLARLVLLYVVPPVALFIVARYVLLIRFDFDVFALRIVTTVVSIVAGLLFQLRERPSLSTVPVFALLVAIASVLGMATVDHLASGDSILPANRFEWIQNGEFVGNIFFAFVMGGVLAIAIKPVRLPKNAHAAGIVGYLALFLAYNLPVRKDQPLDQRVRHFEKVIAFSVSAIAFSGSIYSGFSRWINPSS